MNMRREPRSSACSAEMHAAYHSKKCLFGRQNRVTAGSHLPRHTAFTNVAVSATGNFPTGPCRHPRLKPIKLESRSYRDGTAAQSYKGFHGVPRQSLAPPNGVNDI